MKRPQKNWPLLKKGRELRRKTSFSLKSGFLIETGEENDSKKLNVIKSKNIDAKGQDRAYSWIHSSFCRVWSNLLHLENLTKGWFCNEILKGLLNCANADSANINIKYIFFYF